MTTEKEDSMTTFRATLAEKPRDLLVWLVDHGPQTAVELDARRRAAGLPSPLYGGGLNLLFELGLAELERTSDSEARKWAATDEGRRMVEEARAPASDRRPPIDPRNTWRVIDALGGSREVASEDNARNKARAFDGTCPARECPHRVQRWTGSEWVDA